MSDGDRMSKPQLQAGHGPRGTLRVVKPLPVPTFNPRDTAEDPRRLYDNLDDLPPELRDEPPPLRAYVGRTTSVTGNRNAAPSVDPHARTHPDTTSKREIHDAPSDATPTIAEVIEQPVDLRATGSFANTAPMLESNERIGHYKILHLIATGGFAEIYEASHPELKVALAIKVLQRPFAARADLIRRMRLEAQTLAQIAPNKHIVRIYDCGYDERVGVWIVMERLQGRTLADVSRDVGPMSPVEAIAIVIFLATALHDLHAINIIHRDIKPGNVFLVRDPKAPDGWRVVLLDLGLVRAMDNKSMSDPTRNPGTPGYMAPEQVQSGAVGPASDQYALNHILVELLLGEHVWDASLDSIPKGEEASTLLFWHVHRDIDRPRQIPEDLWPIIARAFSKDPDKRFPSIRDYADALTEYLEVHLGRKVLVEDQVQVLAKRLDGLVKASKAADSDDRKRMQAALSEPRPSERPPPPPRKTAERSVGLEDDLDTPSLYVTEKVDFEQAGHRYPLKTEALIGRDPDLSDIYLEAEGVSRRHVRLRRAAYGTAASPVYEVIDENSRNGTQVDGIPVKTGLLRAHQTLRLDDVEIVLHPPGSIDPITKAHRAPRKGRTPAETKPTRTSQADMQPKPPRLLQARARTQLRMVVMVILFALLVGTVLGLGALLLRSL